MGPPAAIVALGFILAQSADAGLPPDAPNRDAGTGTARSNSTVGRRDHDTGRRARAGPGGGDQPGGAVVDGVRARRPSVRDRAARPRAHHQHRRRHVGAGAHARRHVRAGGSRGARAGARSGLRLVAIRLRLLHGARRQRRREPRGALPRGRRPAGRARRCCSTAFRRTRFTTAAASASVPMGCCTSAPAMRPRCRWRRASARWPARSCASIATARRRPATRSARRSIPTATATRRASTGTPSPASCGPLSTARPATTRST